MQHHYTVFPWIECTLKLSMHLKDNYKEDDETLAEDD